MKRIAVYAGSFDPPTMGHIDIIRKVAPLFDKIYLVVAENFRKKTLFPATERCEFMREAILDLELPKSTAIEVAVHSGLVVDFCKQKGAKFLIRGLRAMSDFESELSICTMNRKLNPEIETILIMSDEEHFFLSSSLVKEISFHGGPLKGMVPSSVEKKLKKQIKKEIQ